MHETRKPAQHEKQDAEQTQSVDAKPLSAEEEDKVRGGLGSTRPTDDKLAAN